MANINVDEIVAGVGGAANIKDILGCITRVRLELADPQAVNEEQLTAAGVKAVVRTESVIQLMVGTDAEEVAQTIADTVN